MSIKSAGAANPNRPSTSNLFSTRGLNSSQKIPPSLKTPRNQNTTPRRPGSSTAYKDTSGKKKVAFMDGEFIR